MRRYTVKLSKSADSFISKNFLETDSNRFIQILDDLQKNPFSNEYSKVIAK